MEENALIIEPDSNSTQSHSIQNAIDPSTSNQCENSSILARNVMDNYLKKHKLDLKILPNKKMIKLSDLTASIYSPSSSLSSSKDEMSQAMFSQSFINIEVNDTASNKMHADENKLVSQECEDFYNDEEEDEGGDEEDDEEDQYRDDEDDFDEEEEEDEEYDEDFDDDFLDEDVDFVENYRNNQKEKDNDILNITCESTTNSIQDFKMDSNETHDKVSKRNRKKREPSLKLKQKLSNEDLEKIVACVKNRQAEVYTADVKKDNYVDKILRVKLLISNDIITNVDQSLQLSNGRMEALLKKSMFSKDLNSLFDTFVSALCIQDYIIDENGVSKPTLKCLVVDCEFKSFSEAEIVRHIKRHLAQDGYTCAICSHQFASMTNLQRHLRIHNGDIGKEIKCIHCDYKASTITHVKRHMAHKHLERSLPCPHCSFMGATNAELKIHMARKHLELTGKNPLFLPKYLRKDYQCNICKIQYNDFKEYQTHMYDHTSSFNRFQCNVCPYNCKNFSKLKRHMLYHTGARNFECKICGNKFFQMEHLKRHMQSIHNVIACDSINLSTSPTSQTIKPKKNTKTLRESKDKKSSTVVPSSFSTMETKVSDDSLILVENEKTNNSSQINQNSSLTQNLDQQSSQEPDCYKITSECVFKCQKCEFSTNKLFTLNDHVISKHVNYANELSNNNEINDESTDCDDEFDDFDDLEENSQECELSTLNGNDLRFSCAFCNFKASKKNALKVTAPILLSNNSVMTHPNTRFQCGSCKSFLDNVNSFIQHMNVKHKIQVYLIDSENESPKVLNTTQTVQNENQMNCHNVETLHPVAPKNTIISSNTSNLMIKPSKTQPNKVTTTTASTKNGKTSHYAQNQHQQIRNFINSSSYLSRQLNNSSNQNTTVRINPLLLKRLDVSSTQTPQNNFFKKQQKHVKLNRINDSQNLHKTPVMYTNQDIDQNQYQNFNPNQEQLESNSFLNTSFLLSNNNEMNDLYSNQFIQINDDCMQITNKNIHIINDNYSNNISNNNNQLI